jgi:hypothetical protein
MGARAGEPGVIVKWLTSCWRSGTWRLRRAVSRSSSQPGYAEGGILYTRVPLCERRQGKSGS